MLGHGLKIDVAKCGAGVRIIIVSVELRGEPKEGNGLDKWLGMG